MKEHYMNINYTALSPASNNILSCDARINSCEMKDE